MATATPEVVSAKDIRKQIDSSLKDVRTKLGPLVEEEKALVGMIPGESVQFASAEGEVAPAAPAPAPAEEAPAPAPAPSGKKRRPTRGGKPTRAEQAVSYIAKNPGVNASQIAESMKIKVNYLYRVLDGLVKDERLVKDGTSYNVA